MGVCLCVCLSVSVCMCVSMFVCLCVCLCLCGVETDESQIGTRVNTVLLSALAGQAASTAKSCCYK